MIEDEETSYLIPEEKWTSYIVPALVIACTLVLDVLILFQIARVM